jgi:hypothetical protein
MSREKRRPEPDEPASAAPGSRMLLIPTCPADPMRLAEEAIERLKREPPPRPVKTSKRKRKVTRR